MLINLSILQFLCHLKDAKGSLNGKGKQKYKMHFTMYTGVRLKCIARHTRGNAAFEVLAPFKSHPLCYTAERAAHCHDDDKRAHPEHYLKKKKPQGDPGYFNFPIGDNEKTYPSATSNVHFERALHEFSETDEVLAYDVLRAEVHGVQREGGIQSCVQNAPGLLQERKLRQRTEGLKEPKEFFEWIACGRKAKCYLCQDDLSSLHAAEPRSKMMERRSSSADNGNRKKDYTRDNIACICDQFQNAKRHLPEADYYVALCCAVAYSAYDAQAARSASFSGAAIKT
jgi:hypothetical protein